MQTIGNKIKKLRELRNFTQQYVAERLGVSQPTYSTIESGELDITLSRLDEISKILGMRIEDVMAFDEKMVFNQQNNHNNYGFIMTQHLSNDKRIEDLQQEVILLKERLSSLERNHNTIE
jgi:transcriptional regulator with XRE-family HTH domain